MSSRCRRFCGKGRRARLWRRRRPVRLEGEARWRAHAPALIDRTFELTPAELRVLQSIVDVGGVPETAVALGIAETTVKTHLHRVFAKTGTSRQADLVKLAAGFSNPLVH